MMVWLNVWFICSVLVMLGGGSMMVKVLLCDVFVFVLKVFDVF